MPGGGDGGWGGEGRGRGREEPIGMIKEEEDYGVWEAWRRRGSGCRVEERRVHY